jgi:pyruvate dehydrogenase E2 component (dihydrolipoamide acetyltransferase)
MATELKLPELGENVTDGDVLKVLVRVGDVIRKEEPILELETGKATVEVPAAVGGRIADIRVKAGDKVKVGQVLMILDQVDAPSTAAPKQPAVAAPPAQGEGRAREGVSSPSAKPAAASVAAVPDRAGEGPISAAPSVRQFAREVGVDIHEVAGSGPGGRISVEDVKKHARQRSSAAASSAAAGEVRVKDAALPDFARFGPTTREPMSQVRLATAQQMSLSWAAIPMVTHYDQADITELEKARKVSAPRAEAAGTKLTLTAVLVKVVASGLKAFPRFNASVDMARREIVFKQYVHVGVAVDTDRGLLVPVIRDADRKTVLQLAKELADLAARARERRVKLDELQGANFTITNLGGLGAKHFSPVINFPESAILGVGRATTLPAYVEGELKPRLLLPLALTYDHRLIDGADAARFLRSLIETLEQPFRLLLEG